MIGRLHHVVLDCPDPAGLAAFWSALLGLPVTYRSADWVVVSRDTTTSGLAFQPAPGHRPSEIQQVHFDVMVDDVADAATRVLALGARWIRGDVFVDPAGHPFCLVRRPGWAPPIAPVDVRVCAIGDSFVLGVGDPEHRGWVGRVAIGSAVTLCNLGVRRATSADVLARWVAECVPRLPAGCDRRLLVSFGVNDTTDEGDGVRVPQAASEENLRTLLGEAASAGIATLVVGPPPVADAPQNARIAALGEVFAAVCAAAAVPFVPVFDDLLADRTWMAEVAAGDGAHPGAAGYARLAELVAQAWTAWLPSPARYAGIREADHREVARGPRPGDA